MKNLLSMLRMPVRAFGRDEGGTVVAEAVIVLPLFLWAYIALFVYWDTFRSMNTVQKAAFTVSDMISREQTGVSPAYIDGVDDVVEYLIDENQDARLRVTQVYWNEDNSRFEVDWSDSPTDGMTPQTTTSLQDYAYEIPSMAPGAVAIILEMEVDYEPSFDIGMPDQIFKQFVVTRPRFPPCLTLAGVTEGCPAGN